MLDLDTVIAQGEEQVSCEVDGEVVLMSVENGAYYKMDDIASRIWALIETPQRVGTLCEQLTSEFDVDRSVCEEDVLDYLVQLLKDNLIQVRPDA